MKQFTTGQINQAVKGTLDGSATIRISGVENLSMATASQLTFIGKKKYIKPWMESQASAAIVNDTLDVEPGKGRALLRVPDADLAIASVLQLFETKPPNSKSGAHFTAVVDETAKIGKGSSIGAGCYVGPGVVIGAKTILYPNVTVLDDSRIGNETSIWSGAVIRERCQIGNHCIIHANATIGGDGFGFRSSPDGHNLIKIPQIGSVEIGDDVEIGAGSCVDRGKFSATTIGDGTKIDNLVQIAHNCRLGRCCVMAGQSALAGSVTLGDGVVIGGGARVKDHVIIGDGAKLGGNTGAISDVAPGETLLGFPAGEYRQTLRIWAAQKRLPELAKLLRNYNPNQDDNTKST